MQHRWKNNLDDRLLDVFEDGADRLNWAWGIDRKHPKHYPINTFYAFVEITNQIANPTPRTKGIRVKMPPPPSTITELVSERTIKAIYEDQNTGRYEDALKEAADFHGSRAWRKIWRAIDAAYSARFSIELIPRPRVHFLHRELLELAHSQPLGGLTLDGVLEFLDDMCPCGRKHKRDAVRKLLRRFAIQHKRL